MYGVFQSILGIVIKLLQAHLDMGFPIYYLYIFIQLTLASV